MPSGFWQWLLTLILWGGAYLLGSVPFGVLIAKSQGKDIRAEGSGNIGATNAGRVLGRTWGIAVFALDVLKSVVPVALARWWLTGCDFAIVTVALAAICGHIWSVFLGFKGGKGVATMLGGLLAVNWVAALLVLVVWAIVTQATRYVSVGSISAVISGAYFVGIFGMPPWYTVWTGACACLVIFTHRENLRRLLSGTESRIGSRRAE